MKRKISKLIFSVVCISSIWLTVPTARAAIDSSAQYRTDQIIIQPRPDGDRAALAAFHAAHSAKVAGTFARAGGAQVITVPAGQTVAGLIAEYQRSGLVLFAEPDSLVYADAMLPNDPYFTNGLLWGLNNYGQSGGTPHADIDAVDAWPVLSSASNIIVAVLDSGIRATHQDLAANMWVSPTDGGHGYNAFDGTNDPSDDGTSHGTMVAGVLGGVGNNGVGVTGVAWRVQMMACKCLNNGTGSDSTVIACIDYAIANGARIINASFDSPIASLSLSNAIVAAGAAGIIWVASAGNSSTNVEVTPSYPTCYGIANVVSVAYTTRTDGLGSLSNYGATHVALGAPGDQIYTTYAATDSYYYPPSVLGITIAGTSFSAPYVAGALALMLAKYPTENYQQIIQRLLNATDPIPALQGKCLTGGRLNLRKALNPNIVLAPVAATTSQWQLSSGPSRLCIVQSSTNLGTWSPYYTNTTSTNGTFIFTNTLTAPQLFFRGAATP